MRIISIVTLVVLYGVGIAAADPGDTVVLYQPDAEVGRRLGGDVESLATFILKSQDCWAQVATSATTRSRSALVVAFGVGRQSAGWIVGGTNSGADDAITRKIRGLQAPRVTDGFVAFAVLGKDFERELKQKEFSPPVPAQWKRIAEKSAKPVSTDDILDSILPKEQGARAIAGVKGKPTLYNHITGKPTTLDETIHRAYESRFTVVDLADPADYTKPRPIAGGLPPSPKTSTGEQLKGYVLLGYVISTEGRATEPVVLKTTDERLSRAALKALEGWRFEPGKLSGTAVSTTAGQEFHFAGN